MTTPILLICFNRPQHTRRVLAEILKQEPQSLYVCQDGAREGNENDSIKCQEVRDVIHELTSLYADTNKHFKLHTLYQRKNLGCGPGPAIGITWFFNNVEQGIIIEDDAVPHSDFFGYAKELLERYKENIDVRAIGSMNVDKHKWGDGSYYFSMMNRNLCAWATWHRAWNDFDLRLMNTSRKDLSHALRKYGCTLLEREYWCDRLDEIHQDGQNNSSWDMQFFMSIWLRQGKGIIPNVNLSTNIGFGAEATHTTMTDHVVANVPTEHILPLVHPSTTDIQTKADRQFHITYFEPYNSGWNLLRRLPYRMNKRLKRWLHHEGPWIKHKKI